MSAPLRDALAAHIRRVRDLQDHVRGNDQAVKQSLIGPVFSLLGYDLTDPRECIPGFRLETGSAKPQAPIDWVFVGGGKPWFFVSAKDTEQKLVPVDERLAHYFGLATEVKLGIATNGLQWRFYTDLAVTDAMDREPFLIWEVLADEEVPFDVLNFLAILQKSQFQPELIRAFAQTNTSRKNLMVTELERLLEPSAEFIKLAVANLETRRLTEGVIEYWKPILANAIAQWARVRTLTSVISQAHSPEAQPPSPAPAAAPAPAVAQEKEWERMKALASVISQPAPAPAPAPVEEPSIRSMTTSAEESVAFETFQAICGEDRPVACENTLSSFNIHFPFSPTSVIARFHLQEREKTVWFPMDAAKCAHLCPGFKVKATQFPSWTSCTLKGPADLRKIEQAVLEAYEMVRALQSRQSTLSIDYVFEKIA